MKKSIDNELLKRAISSNLSRLMQAHGWSQGEVARQLFGKPTTSNRMTVSRWVRGISVPSAADLLNLSICFGVTVEDLARLKRTRVDK